MKVLGQTLFLGATVTSFSTNIGWGNSSSTVTVELVDDLQPPGRVPFRKFDQNKTADYGHLITSDSSATYPDGRSSTVSPLPSGHPGIASGNTRDFYDIDHYIARGYADNHYYDCVGEDCYVDELGIPYATSTTKKEKNIPGKIYYEWVNNKFVSKYWYQEDPGFFATGTKVQPDGSIPRAAGKNGEPLNTSGGLWTYDIINTPVYFKFDNFEFIGLVKNWERNNRVGSITYSVTIESFSNLLDNCYVILDKYGGSIFGRQIAGSPPPKGTPVNNVGVISNFTYTGQLAEGNIPNIFNVYGFLESFGIDFFGGSNINNNGISAVDVLQALSALTSSHSRLDRDSSFSPFGRILTKTIATINGDICNGLNTFGTITPAIGTQRFPVSNAPPANYNAFSLDLSDIGGLISDFRISGSKTISDLLRTVTDANGTDYTIRLVPAMVNDSLYQFVIKIISVDRKSYRSPYNIRSIVTNLENNTGNISNSSFGQESNSSNVTHKFIIGGPQQRLLQVKNYRLPYAQTNYIYNPIHKKFITLNRPWNKARVPDVMSTRHPIISNLYLGGYIGDRININDIERNTRFTSLDTPWRDIEVSAIPGTGFHGPFEFGPRSEETIRGNYNNSALSLVTYESYISTTGDLNPDVETSKPNVPCTPGQLPAGQTLDTHYIDTTCVDFTPQPCPSKAREGDGSTSCKQDPTAQGGAGYYEDPTLDEQPDLSDGGFVPVTGYDQPGARYLNLQNDWICPYFGRAFEEKMPVADDTNEYRSVRPVYLDIWTNQIVVGFSMFELPQLSIGEPISLYDRGVIPNKNRGTFDTTAGGLGRGTASATNAQTPPKGKNDKQPQGTANNTDSWSPLDYDPKRRYVYGTPGFTVTESEMRAAMVSFDSYFAYCLGKSRYSKPDLYMMLLMAYQATGQVIVNVDDHYDGDNLEAGGRLGRGTVGGVSERNVAFDDITTVPTSNPNTNLEMNWNLFLNHNFVKDLQIICEFIKTLADKYYGKKYLVKLPDMVLYRDRQYASIRIPSAYTNIAVYAGSNKIFRNYDLADGAWEEPGNFIDDCMVIGDNFAKAFTDDAGLITPIAGFNSSLNIDDVRQRWCLLDAENKIKNLYHNTLPNNGRDMINELLNMKVEIDAILSNPFSLGVTDSEIDSINLRIRPIIEKYKKASQTDALKQMQVFGATINCLSSASHANIHEQWNKMWSSLKETLSPTNLRSIRSVSKLADQWRKIISDAEKASYNFDLLTFGVPSLDISSLGGGDDADFVVIPVSSKKEPFGRQSPRSSKLFIKSNSENIVFMNILNFTDPRAVMTVDKIDVFDSSLAYVKDPSLSIIANIAIEDSALYIKIKNRLNAQRDARNDALEEGDNEKAREYLNDIKVLKKEVDYLRMLKQYIVPEIDPRYLVVDGPSANPSVNHAMMAPRTAHPYFFAIPLKSNQFCYGPWSNYADEVVPQPYINNLIHQTKVDIDTELVPWKYGSTSALDLAVSYRLNADVNYQTVIENGTVSMVGPPLFGLGGVFHSDPSRIVPGAFRFDNGWYKPYYASYVFFDTKRNGYRELTYDCIKLVHKEVNVDGPLISNIYTQTNENGIVTNYRFQTYNPKTGLYSKTYEDALKEMASDRNKFQKALSDLQTNLISKILLERNNILKKARTDRQPVSISKFKTALYGQSPIEIFVGQNIQSIKNPVWHSDINTSLIKDPGDNPLPGPDNDESKIKFLNQRRQYSWVGGVMGIEIGAELAQDYNCKSAMSMDGLLSPVSFYPTKASRTYNISTYVGGSGVPVGLGNTNTTCPYCYNKRIISVPYINYHSDKRADSGPTDINIPCPVCSRAKLEVKKEDKFPDKETGTPDVNIYSLNPIVVSDGEFRNPYASGIDRCRHSIAAVARGEYNPIEESFYIQNNINTYRDGHNPDFARFDTKVKELENINVLLNQRFFALRGPLMMHGWGYDTDGYPVPNALDMPYSIDDKGRPLRFQLILNTGDKKFGSNNLELPGKYLIPENNNTPLGDIITTRYEWKGDATRGIDTGNGKWSKKNKPSKKFYLNWAERPDTWPVGPIDMRWDASRRVWDASGGGCKEEILPPFIVTNKNDISTLQEFLDSKTENKCPYRNVYITLENDMIKEDDYDTTYSTRGFIDDVEYNKEPLQNGYRRLVYVIDKTGYTAPKGTKLLCRYDRLSGFYEPLSKPSVTAIGTVGSSNSANIRAHYVQGRRAGVAPTFVVNFDNPLDLAASVGNKGIFIFINGKWTLSSVKV